MVPADVLIAVADARSLPLADNVIDLAAARLVASLERAEQLAEAMRAAAVRPESTMTTTCRSRSGRHVRTMSVCPGAPPGPGPPERRAVARQSIERTSSPNWYSRTSENAIPRPLKTEWYSPENTWFTTPRVRSCRRAFPTTRRIAR